MRHEWVPDPMCDWATCSRCSLELSLETVASGEFEECIGEAGMEKGRELPAQMRRGQVT